MKIFKNVLTAIAFVFAITAALAFKTSGPEVSDVAIVPGFDPNRSCLQIQDCSDTGSQNCTYIFQGNTVDLVSKVSGSCTSTVLKRL